MEVTVWKNKAQLAGLNVKVDFMGILWGGLWTAFVSISCYELGNGAFEFHKNAVDFLDCLILPLQATQRGSCIVALGT
jgi:hypothetical protein